jgi:acetate---CoA ligase (ADP-forming)
MSLKDVFNPKSIAIIGASRDEKSAGHGVLKNLVEGGVLKSRYCHPFEGKILPVNPNADKILGLTCYKSISDIKENVDVAIIAVPSQIVECQVELCIKKKVKGVIIMSSGFSENGQEGKNLQDRIAAKLKKAKIDLIGPNCLGIIRTSTHLNATFSPTMPPRGKIAFISQSGALANSIIDWSIEERYGFSSIVSVGNAADKDISDFLEYFGNDKETKVITLYMEGIRDGKKFMRIAKKVSRKKPIIAIKAGKTAQGKKAISSHTGSLAGDYEIYKAAFSQSGVIIAESVEEMFDIAKAISTQPIPKKNAIAIITNGGGPGVLCADYCTEFGVNLVELDSRTIKDLEDCGYMHKTFSRRNPLDIVGDALSERYKAAINILLSKDYICGAIVIQTLQTMTETFEDSKVIVEAHKKFPSKPILCTYIGGRFSKPSITYLENHGVPDFNDVRKTAKVMAALVSRLKK